MQPLPPEKAALVFAVFGLLITAIVAAWVSVIVRLALGLPVLPREKPRIVPWGGKSVMAVVLAWFAILVFVPVAYRMLEGGGPAPAKANAERPALSAGELMTLSGLENFATLLIIPAILAATSGASLRDFGVKLSGLGHQMFRGMVTYPLIAPLVFGVMGLSVYFLGRNPHPLETAIRLDRSPGMATILILAGVVLAPFAEEIIFRGVLLGWLTKVALGVRKASPAENFELGELLPAIAAAEPTAEVFDLPETPTELEEGPSLATAGEPFNPYAPPRAPIDPAVRTSKVFQLAMANVAVSVIFAGLHAAVWPTPIPIFFLSLGLGLLYQQTGSIIGPVVLHMLFNGVSTLLMFIALETPQPPAEKPKPVDPVPPPAMAPAFRPSEAAFNRAIPGIRHFPQVGA